MKRAGVGWLVAAAGFLILALCFSGCGNAGDGESYIAGSRIVDFRDSDSLAAGAPVSDSGLGDSADERAYYWQSEGRSFYPLGLNGSICGLAANGETVFVCGVENERLALAAMDYEIAEGQCVFGDEREIELPELADGARAVS